MTMINCKLIILFLGGCGEILQQSGIKTSQIQVVETSISFLFRVAKNPPFFKDLQHGQGGKANGGKFAPAKWLGDQAGPKAQSMAQEFVNSRLEESRAFFFWGGDSNGL